MPQARTFAHHLTETRAVIEPMRLAASMPELARRRAAVKRTVIVLPGLGATDSSMLPLRRYLTRIGHRAHPWTLGRHTRDVPVTVGRFLGRLDAVAAEAGPVALVGWSLGGVVAREAAHHRPGAVDVVVTFGTPLLGPRHTAAARAYTSEELDLIDALISERRHRPPLGCRVVAIHSRNDGIVDWRSCIDTNPGVTNVEVRSSHFGMGIDPDVWRAIADALD